MGRIQYRTLGENGILSKMKNYKPHDAFAMLYITTKDLYPGPDWTYCYGWANPVESTGVFSFLRYDPVWDGLDDPNREKTWLHMNVQNM